jgi:uncharacterized membrane protein YqjE
LKQTEVAMVLLVFSILTILVLCACELWAAYRK